MGVAATASADLVKRKSVSSVRGLDTLRFVAALWVAFKRKPGPRPIAIGATVLGLSSIALALSTSFPLSLLAMAIAGAGGIAMAVSANATIQLAVPDQLRGRVMSVYTTVFAGSVPVGGLLMGAIASAWSVPLALLIGALVTTGIGVGGWFWLRRIEARTPRVVPTPRPERVRQTVATADIGAIDPEGRSSGVVTSARPR